MAQITAAMVKELREKTGIGMMECKKALAQTDGDLEKAIDVLRERGLQIADKKASRVAADGLVSTYQENGVTVILEVNSESDFVASNDLFVSFVNGVAKTIVEERPKDVDALLACKYAGDGEGTVNDVLKERIAVIKENIKIRRFEIIEGAVVTYVHAGGTVAAAVKFDADADTAAKDEFKEMGKNVAMQVVSMSPSYLDPDSVPADVLAHEKEVLKAEMDNDPKFANKPDAVKEKILPGKLNKFYDENCLVKQAYIKDDKITVAQYVESVAKSLGANFKVTGFVRYAKGEGIEKRNDNLADEVKAMIGG
jgi:elongation factor Ts